MPNPTCRPLGTKQLQLGYAWGVKRAWVKLSSWGMKYITLRNHQPAGYATCTSSSFNDKCWLIPVPTEVVHKINQEPSAKKHPNPRSHFLRKFRCALELFWWPLCFKQAQPLQQLRTTACAMGESIHLSLYIYDHICTLSKNKAHDIH